MLLSVSSCVFELNIQIYRLSTVAVVAKKSKFLPRVANENSRTWRQKTHI